MDCYSAPLEGFFWLDQMLKVLRTLSRTALSMLPFSFVHQHWAFLFGCWAASQQTHPLVWRMPYYYYTLTFSIFSLQDSISEDKDLAQEPSMMQFLRWLFSASSDVLDILLLHSILLTPLSEKHHFSPGLFFYVYIESPYPKNPEGPTPQAPNPINWKPNTKKPNIRPQPQNHNPP